jgi:hypothetical protein
MVSDLSGMFVIGRKTTPICGIRALFQVPVPIRAFVGCQRPAAAFAAGHMAEQYISRQSLGTIILWRDLGSEEAGTPLPRRQAFSTAELKSLGRQFSPGQSARKVSLVELARIASSCSSSRFSYGCDFEQVPLHTALLPARQPHPSLDWQHVGKRPPDSGECWTVEVSQVRFIF